MYQGTLFFYYYNRHSPFSGTTDGLVLISKIIHAFKCHSVDVSLKVSVIKAVVRPAQVSVATCVICAHVVTRMFLKTHLRYYDIIGLQYFY